MAEAAHPQRASKSALTAPLSITVFGDDDELIHVHPQVHDGVVSVPNLYELPAKARAEVERQCEAWTAALAAAAAESKNPFPAAMTVPGVDGEDIAVELAVVDGVVYAPRLDELPLAPAVRQYVTQYCAAWSTSVLTLDKLDARGPVPPRRAQIVFNEPQLHAMLGLAADERLVRTVVDGGSGAVTFIVESPRLPVPQYWDVPPPFISLPIAAHYEARQS